MEDLALDSVRHRRVQTAWSDAGVMPGDPDWAGGTTFVDSRSRQVSASAEETFRAVSRIGGEHGYYAADWLWWIRGMIDRLFGGPGLRRGRRNPTKIVYGDAIDFWRVTDVKNNRRLELRAEMKLPGTATLEFEVEPIEGRRSRLRQIARFKPKGLFGILYWYGVLPLHGLVFEGMLRGICKAAEEKAQAAPEEVEEVQDTSALSVR